MARGALLVARIEKIMRTALNGNAVVLTAKRSGTVVALDTHGEHHWPLEQLRIRGTMRGMTAFAAFNAHRRVFKDKRSALFLMASQARLFISEALVDKPGTCAHSPIRGESSMRIMAIGTMHRAFVYSMFERH